MPSVTRRAARSPEHREAVVAELSQAVRRLLAEGHGYTALGVQRIADEAGIARSTFYLYFPDKTALLMRITESATEALFAAAEAWLKEGFADIGALESTILDVIAQQREHAVLLAALNEVSGYDQEVAVFWRGRVGGFVDLLAHRIADGQDVGTIAATLDPATTAAWTAWGVERLLSQHVAAQPESEDPALASGLARAIWSTLGR